MTTLGVRPQVPAANFREPGAAQAGGYVLAVAGLLVAAGLSLHSLPACSSWNR